MIYIKYKILNIIPISIGVLGLIPYLIFFLNNFLNFYNLIHMMNLVLTYSSLLLSFMGAIYWGLGLRTVQYNDFAKKIKLEYFFIFSIVPFFLGMSFFIFEQKIGIIFLILGFTFCQIIDEYIYFNIMIMKWYMILRRILTVIVVSNLIYCYIKSSYY